MAMVHVVRKGEKAKLKKKHTQSIPAPTLSPRNHPIHQSTPGINLNLMERALEWLILFGNAAQIEAQQHDTAGKFSSNSLTVLDMSG